MEMTSKTKTNVKKTSRIRQAQIEHNPENKDNLNKWWPQNEEDQEVSLQIEDDLKKEENIKNEDDLQINYHALNIIFISLASL